MSYCKYCGAELHEQSNFCQQCGKPIANVPAISRNPTVDIDDGQTDNIFIKYYHALTEKIPPKVLLPAIIIIVGLILTLVLSVGSGKCKYPNCSNRAVSGYHYCYEHKCSVNDCDSYRTYDSNFCYIHSKLYDTDSRADYADLVISNVQLENSYGRSYTYAKGVISNNGSKTVKYIKIKGSFVNRYGDVVDTDWTYAVGSEGLAPGESCKWQMSVKYDSSITNCRVSIIED